jgi:co-chaperonin GroES (HSP10)
MILVLKDDDKGTTSGGIILPEKSKTPVITCRVLEIGPQVDLETCPIREYCRVLVKPQSAVPIDFEDNNKKYIIKSTDILAYEEISEEESYEFQND